MLWRPVTESVPQQQHHKNKRRRQRSMGKASAGGYYAVAIGRRTGIFRSWDEAEAQVKGFTGARFKKFPTQLQAEAFVVSNAGSSAMSSTVSPSPEATGRKRSRSADDATSIVGSATISPPNSKRQALATPPSSSVFYAVLEGHTRGIYSSWGDVLKQTEGYTRPLYRKFDSREAAEGYVAGYTHAQQPTAREFVAVDTEESSDGNNTPKSGGGFWYAVAKGRKTGVFDTWAEAKLQIDGLYSAKYKKFASKTEAEAFVRDHQEATGNRPGDPDPKHPDSLVAFCDGSALQNGRFGCQAGYACIFPHNPAWNVAKKVVEAKATNNRAEYLAALEAFKRANIEDPTCSRPLFIFSDSMLLIRSMTEWVVGWQKKNWVKADGNPVMNRDLLEQLVAARKTRRVIWRHVKAHTGKKDWWSKWNDVADHAARNAAAGWDAAQQE